MASFSTVDIRRIPLAGIAALSAPLLMPACSRSQARTGPTALARPEAPLNIPLPRTLPVARVVYF